LKRDAKPRNEFFPKDNKLAGVELLEKALQVRHGGPNPHPPLPRINTRPFFNFSFPSPGIANSENRQKIFKGITERDH
jgi:hypothetical protein